MNERAVVCILEEVNDALCYHITNAFKKILANNIAAAQQYFKSFRV